MVSQEFVMAKLHEQARWKTLPIMCTSTLDGQVSVGVIVTVSPFNLWIPLEQVREEDFSPRTTTIDPAIERELIRRYAKNSAA